MRKYVFVCLLLALAVPVAAQYEDLAEKIVTTSAAVKPGEAVIITGGAHSVPFLEALSIAASKAGARGAPIILSSDKTARANMTDVPEQYLGQRALLLDWLPTVDVWITTPSVQDVKAVMQGVPESRVAAARKSGAETRQALNQSKVRQVAIGLPTKQAAELAEMDFPTYEKMQLEAISADYQQISAKGDRLAQMLRGAKTVRVTSPVGTDFTFQVGNRPVLVNAGMFGKPGAASAPFLARAISLPGGDLSFAPMETSGNGKIVVPKDNCRPYEKLTGASYEFRDGKMTSFKAEGNADCFRNNIAPYTGEKDRLGWFSIGLNPALKVIETGGDYRPVEAAGMVIIGMGNNQLFGGSNNTNFGWLIPVVNATVELDGKTVVKDGQLTF